MNILVMKLGATGDVVRTTSLLRRLPGRVTWITAEKNTGLLRGLEVDVRCLAWGDREQARGTKYDLVINLEDDQETGAFLSSVPAKQVFGAYLGEGGSLRYTDDAKAWFDLSLISRFGRQKADELKFLNRKTYQELIFAGLGFEFKGERYVLPDAPETDLAGDVALSTQAGPVWPMKNWAYYEQLKASLEAEGLKVNVLPVRTSLLEHLGDVNGHRCLVSGDSLPMHLALGCGVQCVSLFTCTSPWEIYDYGIQRKFVSPLLGEFYYKRGFDARATTAIGLEEVKAAVLGLFEPAATNR